MSAGYHLLDVELTAPFAAAALDPGQGGWGIVARCDGRIVGFSLVPRTASGILAPVDLASIADREFAAGVLTARAEREIEAARPPTERPPGVSIVICTKDRAQRLTRLLAVLDRVRHGSAFPVVEIIVVDNASVDAATRDAVVGFADVKYVYEPKPGLNFARNTALASAGQPLIAYLDDDVVVDRGWLDGLAAAWRSNPSAGGFTGLVLPFRLDTEARLLFEQRGGFGRGIRRREFRRTSLAFPLHPTGAGVLGAGCNMAFDRQLLLDLGGFDNALDTGAPLPGGGDLDIFYRVLRSGRGMVYEPRYAVFHEHRETIAQLRRQYWTWGLGMMAFLDKSRRADPAARPQHRALLRWWLLDQLRLMAVAARRVDGRLMRFHLAELAGGVQGWFGEYDRSRARIAAIRAGAA